MGIIRTSFKETAYNVYACHFVYGYLQLYAVSARVAPICAQVDTARVELDARRKFHNRYMYNYAGFRSWTPAVA